MFSKLVPSKRVKIWEYKIPRMLLLSGNNCSRENNTPPPPTSLVRAPTSPLSLQETRPGGRLQRPAADSPPFTPVLPPLPVTVLSGPRPLTRWRPLTPDPSTRGCGQVSPHNDKFTTSRVATPDRWKSREGKKGVSCFYLGAHRLQI